MSENPAEGLTAPGETDAGPGLYVHVPFCATTCDFCAFYQTTPTAEGIRLFLDGVVREGRLVEWPRPARTVFWGGGTPGLLSPRALAALAEACRAWVGEAPWEWTVELAPASVTEERLAVLRDAGVTRISLGVQSFAPDLLSALGRRHTREQVLRAYERVRAADFRSVNLDLMFALPGQDETALVSDLDEAIALAPDHLSTYCLTFEEDTALWVKLSQGKVKLDTAHEARLYRATWERLEAAGYAQYEVSNFSRPGHACLHNLNTWHMGEWVGLGPAAASQYGGWRGANPSDLDRWLTGLGEGRRATEEQVQLTPALLAEDALIFGLRLNVGVDFPAWRARFPQAGTPALEEMFARLEEQGLMERAGRWLRLTSTGRLLADAIGAELLGLVAPQAEGSAT